MKFLVINGPNLNLLGLREPDIYGKKNYEALCSYIKSEAEKLDVIVEIFQSNHEGAIVDKIQETLKIDPSLFDSKIDGIIINPAAYTHTSIAILDALKAVNIPTVEVHLTDIYTRDDFRKISITGNASLKIFYGQGFKGYKEAMKFLKNHILFSA